MKLYVFKNKYGKTRFKNCGNIHNPKYMTKDHRVIACESLEAIKKFIGTLSWEIVEININKSHKIFNYPKYMDLCMYESYKNNGSFKPEFYTNDINKDVDAFKKSIYRS